MSFLKTIYFCALVVVLTFYHALVVIVVNFWYRLQGKEIPFLLGGSVGTLWAQRIIRFTPGWSIKVTGTENIPPQGTSYIAIANHESAIDIFSIYAIGSPFRWVAKAELFKIPMFGHVARLCGHIPVKRGFKTSHAQALQACASSVRGGMPVFLFPEGTRSTEGKPKKFKAGAFKLASDAKVPVLPIVLFGAGKLLEKGSFTPKRALLRIHVLPLVHLIEGENIDQFTQRVEKIVHDEHYRLSLETSTGLV